MRRAEPGTVTSASEPQRASAPRTRSDEPQLEQLAPPHLLIRSDDDSHGGVRVVLCLVVCVRWRAVDGRRQAAERGGRRERARSVQSMRVRRPSCASLRDITDSRQSLMPNGRTHAHEPQQIDPLCLRACKPQRDRTRGGAEG